MTYLRQEHSSALLWVTPKGTEIITYRDDPERYRAALLQLGGQRYYSSSAGDMLHYKGSEAPRAVSKVAKCRYCGRAVLKMQCEGCGAPA